MLRKMVLCMILVLLIAQFMAVDTTLAGSSIIHLIGNASPRINVEMSGDIFAEHLFRDFKWESILAKPKPTSTPEPPIIPTSTPEPPIIPTNTPVPPIIPTNTPVPPIIPTKTPVPPTIPTKTPTATTRLVQSSTSTPVFPINTPTRIKTFTLSPVSPTGMDADVKDLTPTPNMPSPVSTLADTSLKSSPTSSQLVNFPITGNSTSAKPENTSEGLSTTSFLGILILGLIGVGGLVFGDQKFLGSPPSDDSSPDDG